MKTVFYRPTGKFTHQGAVPGEFEIVRNNEIHAPEFLKFIPNRASLFKDGDIQNGVDSRLNAVGDTADIATGYQLALDTMTFQKQQRSSQKFYTVDPSEFMPVIVGEGAFAESILFQRDYLVGEDFEAGYQDAGQNDARQSSIDAAIDGVTALNKTWIKGLGWNLIEIERAMRANNWDPIGARMSAMKKNWDLGLQLAAFFGVSNDNTRFPGLFTQTGITIDTSFITAYISGLSATNLQTFIAGLISKYNVASAGQFPDTFIMPMVDYLGLQVPFPGTVGTYPVPIIDFLEQAFKKATRNPNFKIIPTNYADKATNNTLRGLNKNVYMLLRQDPETIQMNIPVPFTITAANSINNFNFHATAYGQHSGVTVLRNLEVLMFTF